MPRFYCDQQIAYDEVLTDDRKLELLRIKRNSLLMKTDWTMLGDAKLTQEQKALMARYRQQLRDLPCISSNPDLIVFPTEPNLKGQ